MAQGVVQGFEVVQIDEQQCPMTAAARTRGQGLVEAVHQQPAIGQAGQRIVEGQAPDLLLSVLTLGDVHQGADEMGHHPLRIFHRRDGEPLRINLATLASVPDLPLPVAVEIERLPERLIKRRIMPAGLEQAGLLAFDLLRPVTGDGRESLVHPQDVALRIGDHHALLGFEDRGRDSQLLFDPALFGDVADQHAGHPGAVAALEDRAGELSRKGLAIGADQRQLTTEPAHLGTLLQCCLQPWIRSIDQAIAAQGLDLALTAAKQTLGLEVGRQHPPVRRGQERRIEVVVEDQAEQRLTLDQGRLHLLALGDVGDESVPGDGPFRAFLRAGVPKQPAHGAITVAHPVLVLPQAEFAGRFADRFAQARHILRVQHLEHRPRIVAHLLGADVVDALDRLAGEWKAGATLLIHLVLVHHPGHAACDLLQSMQGHLVGKLQTLAARQHAEQQPDEEGRQPHEAQFGEHSLQQPFMPAFQVVLRGQPGDHDHRGPVQPVERDGPLHAVAPERIHKGGTSFGRPGMGLQFRRYPAIADLTGLHPLRQYRSPGDQPQILVTQNDAAMLADLHARQQLAKVLDADDRVHQAAEAALRIQVSPGEHHHGNLDDLACQGLGDVQALPGILAQGLEVVAVCGADLVSPVDLAPEDHEALAIGYPEELDLGQSRLVAHHRGSEAGLIEPARLELTLDIVHQTLQDQVDLVDAVGHALVHRIGDVLRLDLDPLLSRLPQLVQGVAHQNDEQEIAQDDP